MKRIYINLQDPTITKDERNKELKRAATRRWYTRHKSEYIPSPSDVLQVVGRRREFTVEEALQRHNDRSRNHMREIRLETIAHYGGRCVFCGDTNTNHLCIDHIDGGGKEHRRSIHGDHIYRWLLKNNYPSGYQLLCNNHNMEKAFYHTMTLDAFSIL